MTNYNKLMSDFRNDLYKFAKYLVETKPTTKLEEDEDEDWYPDSFPSFEISFLYITPDDKIFDDYEEALQHCVKWLGEEYITKS